jgi:PAS domain S-box-containing protein
MTIWTPYQGAVAGGRAVIGSKSEGELLLARMEMAEAQYKALIDQISAITYTEALDTGSVTTISPQVLKILGYSQEEWMGGAHLWTNRIHPEDRDRVVEACDVANAQEAPYSEEYRIRTKDGRFVWIRDEAVIVRGREGRSLCWQGVMVLLDRPVD